MSRYRQKPLRITLGGKPWKIRWARAQHEGTPCWGVTDHTSRVITIDPGAAAAGVERETILHECLHAIFPFLNEDVVMAAGGEMDDVLSITGCE